MMIATFNSGIICLYYAFEGLSRITLFPVASSLKSGNMEKLFFMRFSPVSDIFRRKYTLVTRDMGRKKYSCNEIRVVKTECR